MRKKLFLTVLMITSIAGVLSAQGYRKFRVGLGVGYTVTPGGGVGLFYSLEPAWHLSDDLLLGFKFERAGNNIDPNGFSDTYSSYTVNAQYYFGDRKFRPFAGVGFGYYKLSLQYIGHDSKPGIYPRIGFDYNHGFIALDYNLMESTQTNDDYTVTNSYLSMRFGFFIGGGRKQPLPQK